MDPEYSEELQQDFMQFSESFSKTTTIIILVVGIILLVVSVVLFYRASQEGNSGIANGFGGILFLLTSVAFIGVGGWGLNQWLEKEALLAEEEEEMNNGTTPVQETQTQEQEEQDDEEIDEGDTPDTNTNNSNTSGNTGGTGAGGNGINTGDWAENSWCRVALPNTTCQSTNVNISSGDFSVDRDACMSQPYYVAKECRYEFPEQVQNEWTQNPNNPEISVSNIIGKEIRFGVNGSVMKSENNDKLYSYRGDDSLPNTLVSPNGNDKLSIGMDGRLYLYSGNNLLWTNNTNTRFNERYAETYTVGITQDNPFGDRLYFFTIQSDGNAIVKFNKRLASTGKTAVWSTGKDGVKDDPVSTIRVINGGQLQKIRTSDNQIVWKRP